MARVGLTIIECKLNRSSENFIGENLELSLTFIDVNDNGWLNTGKGCKKSFKIF
jgi:hypothetical protein